MTRQSDKRIKNLVKKLAPKVKPKNDKQYDDSLKFAPDDTEVDHTIFKEMKRKD